MSHPSIVGHQLSVFLFLGAQSSPHVLEELDSEVATVGFGGGVVGEVLGVGDDISRCHEMLKISPLSPFNLAHPSFDRLLHVLIEVYALFVLVPPTSTPGAVYVFPLQEVSFEDVVLSSFVIG